jgi:hypothetical protein
MKTRPGRTATAVALEVVIFGGVDILGKVLHRGNANRDVARGLAFTGAERRVLGREELECELVVAEWLDVEHLEQQVYLREAIGEAWIAT